MRRIGRYFLIGIGVVSLALGAIGVAVPLLPSTPFFLLAAFCFARGSARLHAWLLTTKLYRRHLESFAERRSMTLRAKSYTVCAITVLMGVGVVAMRGALMGQICLALVWLCHMLYFAFGVKTIANGKQLTEATEQAESD